MTLSKRINNSNYDNALAKVIDRYLANTEYKHHNMHEKLTASISYTMRGCSIECRCEGHMVGIKLR